MPLTTEQKSVYLVILNATMILRSIGKTFKSNRMKLKTFKKELFKEVVNLTSRMERNILKEKDIIVSIERISKSCKISFGQSQKAINVLLKYHYYLYKRFLKDRVKVELHCPLDSFILDKLRIWESLTNIGKEEYLLIRQKILKKKFPRINFDKQWDEQHLRDEGIL